MRRMFFMVAVLAPLAYVAVAEARTTITSYGSLPYQEWVDQAKVPTPDVPVGVTEMATEDPAWPCFTEYGYDPNGCVYLEDRAIYLDPMRLSEQGTVWKAVRWTLWHELGHLFDGLYLTPEDRTWFATFAHMPTEPWLSTATHETAGELFAEAYATCAHYGGRYPTWGAYETLTFPPEDEVGPRRFKRLCQFMRAAYWH